MVISISNSCYNPNVPLKHISVFGNMEDNHGELTVTQIYENTYEKPIEAQYTFNLTRNSVITAFSMKIGEKTIIGKAISKYKAKTTYEVSKSSGKQTALLEKCMGLYSASIGNILPGEQVTISFTYLTTLDINATGFKFLLPTNIAPIYTSSSSSKKSNYHSITYSTGCNYEFNLRLEWYTGGKFTAITSPTNELVFLENSDTKKIIVSSTKPSSGDIVIYAKTDATTILYDYHDEITNNHYMMLAQQVPDIDVDSRHKIYSFILDRSESMIGTKMEHALESLELFIRSLPEGSYFNVISFGSSHCALWDHSVPYDENTMKICLDQISKFSANMGGTEIYNCINSVLNESYLSFTFTNKMIAPEDMENIVILLTDGQVTNDDEIVQMVKKHNEINIKKFRFFGIGIGYTASRYLLENITNATYGSFKMIVEEKTLSDAVIELMSRVKKQYYKDVTLESGTFGLHNAVMYPETYFATYCKLTNDEYKLFCENGLHVSFTNGLTNEIVTNKITHTETQAGQPYLKKMYANERITNRTYLDKSEVYELSVENQLMNDFTSFVLSDDTVVTSDEAPTIIVPHYYRDITETNEISVNVDTMIHNIIGILHRSEKCELFDEPYKTKTKRSLGEKISSGITPLLKLKKNISESAPFLKLKDNISGIMHFKKDTDLLPSKEPTHNTVLLSDSVFAAEYAIKYSLPSGAFKYDKTNYGLINCSNHEELEKYAIALGLDVNVYFNVRLYKLFMDLNESKYKLIVAKMKLWLEKQIDLSKFVPIA